MVYHCAICSCAVYDSKTKSPLCEHCRTYYQHWIYRSTTIGDSFKDVIRKEKNKEARIENE